MYLKFDKFHNFNFKYALKLIFQYHVSCINRVQTSTFIRMAALSMCGLRFSESDLQHSSPGSKQTNNFNGSISGQGEIGHLVFENLCYSYVSECYA